MDQQKLSFVLYVTSAFALIYAAFLNSPLQFAHKGWENTPTPAVFFGIVAIMILHVVFTGKMLSEEKLKKVNITSLCMFLLAGLIAIPAVSNTLELIPRMIGAFFA